MSKLTVDAKIEKLAATRELVMYVWGHRLVIAYLPDEVEVTDKLAAKLSEAWNATSKALPQHVVRRLAQELALENV